MRAYSLNELFSLTRNELFALHARIVAELPTLPERTAERETAVDNLRRIRGALSIMRPAPS